MCHQRQFIFTIHFVVFLPLYAMFSIIVFINDDVILRSSLLAQGRLGLIMVCRLSDMAHVSLLLQAFQVKGAVFLMPVIQDKNMQEDFARSIHCRGFSATESKAALVSGEQYVFFETCQKFVYIHQLTHSDVRPQSQQNMRDFWLCPKMNT